MQTNIWKGFIQWHNYIGIPYNMSFDDTEFKQTKAPHDLFLLRDHQTNIYIVTFTS